MTLISENIPKKDRERLNNLYNKAINIVYNAVGKKTYENYHNGADYIDVAPLGNRVYGYCWRNSMCGYSTIFLNEKLLSCTDEEIMEVLIHEILHSFINTKGHNKIWKYYANIVSKKSDYNVTRTGHIESFNHEFKYEVECLDCGFKSGFYKLSKKRRIKLDNNDFKCCKCESKNLKITNTGEHRRVKSFDFYKEENKLRDKFLYSYYNKEELLLLCEKCGCYNCLKIFSPQEIIEWVQESNGFETAICPYCRFDTVIGDYTDYDINEDNLKAMYKLFFDEE